MTDRLTEIKARVAKCNEQHTNGYAGCSLCDLKFALGEIERLHDISAFNGLTEQVKALSAERDRLRAEVGALREALIMVRPLTGAATRSLVDAVLEESK